jgi:hypothetical protein
MVDPSQQLPNFFLLGATRSGTSSLVNYLQQHPNICFTEPRDPSFFRKDQLYERGLDYYLRSFCRHTNGRPWRGEASSTYFAFPHIVGPRLRAHFGDTPLKFVVLLREPVARAWSHYLFRFQHGDEKRDFATALAQEPEAHAASEARYFAEGCYMRLLKEWQTYYPLESFLLLLSEDLAADPLVQVQRVFQWLDVDTTVPIDVSKRLNLSHIGRKPSPSWLRTIGERIWPNLWRRQSVQRDPGEQFYGPYDTLPVLDPAVAIELRKQYHYEVLALSKFLGRYLSHWLSNDELEELLERSVAQVQH